MQASLYLVEIDIANLRLHLGKSWLYFHNLFLHNSDSASTLHHSTIQDIEQILHYYIIVKIGLLLCLVLRSIEVITGQAISWWNCGFIM
jgi:hypothetical protein